MNISVQTGNLGKVAETVTGLINNPPTGISDLRRLLGELPLPDLSIGSDFVKTLGSLEQAVPTDLSGVTGELTGRLEGLKGSIGTGVTSVLKNLLAALDAVGRLSQLNFKCEEDGGTGAAATPAPAPASGESGAGASAAATPASPLPSKAKVDEVNSALDLLPNPLNVESFLGWLDNSLKFPQRKSLLPRSIPLLDDLHDPLETLFAWKGMDSTGVRDHLATTINDTALFLTGVVRGDLERLVATIDDLSGKLPKDSLKQIAVGLTTRLGELKSAIQSGIISGTGGAVAEMNTLLDQYGTLSITMSANLLNSLDGVNRNLDRIADDLLDGMDRASAALIPNDSLGVLGGFVAPVGPALTTAMAEVEAWLAWLIDWLKELTDKIDLSAVQTPLKTVADGVRSALDGLDSVLSAVALETRKLFTQVEGLIDGIDTKALTDELDRAIDKFGKELVDKLRELFKPVQELVTKAIDNIDKGVAAFKPEEIVVALKDVIGKLAGVLQDPAIANAMNRIREVLEKATEELKALSFSPLTGQVVSGIGEVTATLRGIDTSKLSTALQLALQGALAILPENLTPVTDPLLDEFGKLIDEGPIPLIEKVKAQPERLLATVKRFEPATLLGDVLSGPFNDLIGQMEAFKPGNLLKPVSGELETLKGRLRGNANPGKLIQPLEAPFNELLLAFDRLKPEELVKPLEKLINDAANAILDAIPLDAVFDEVDATLKKVTDIIGLADALTLLLERIRGLVNGFADSSAQMDTFLDGILVKVEGIADTSTLDLALLGLNTALDGIKSVPLSELYQGSLDPLEAALSDLDPQKRMTGLLEGYRGVSRIALDALPASPEKTAIQGVLARFDPLQPAFGAPFALLADWQEALKKSRDKVGAIFANWDDRYHASDGPFAGLRTLETTPSTLKGYLKDALEPQFTTPLKALFGIPEPVSTLLGSILTKLQEVVNSLKAKVAGLLLGPDSLGAIRDTMKELEKRLREFNLGFITDSLKQVFDEVKGKLEGVSPAHLRQQVEKSFDDMLAVLEIGLVLPASDLAKLDADFDKVIDKLKLLDPKKLVIDVVQPEFDKTITPLLAVFDVTKVLDALIERLKGLDGELKQELSKVNEAYQGMRDAVPPLSIGLEISVELPF